MFRGLAPSDFHSLLAWGSLFRKQLFRQQSLASFLWLVQQSQTSTSRVLWYQTCFFLASLSRIAERPFYQWFNRRWQHSIFFFLTDQSFFFRSLEYYSKGVDYLKFSSRYLRGTSLRPTKVLLPFSRFHLRAPGTLFITLWYHSEQLRMRFFNDYVRTHELLTHSFFLPRRFRFQRTIFSYRIRCRRKLLFRYIFFFNTCNQRYSVVEYRGLNVNNQVTVSSFSPLEWSHMISSSSTLNLALATKNLPLARFWKTRPRFFLANNYLQLNLWAHTLLARVPLKMRALNRLDWSHFLSCFPVFLLFRRVRHLLSALSDRLINQFFKTTYQEMITADSFVFFSLQKLVQPLATSPDYCFLWKLFSYRVNSYWNYNIVDRWSRITVYTNTRTKAKRFRLNYQIFHFILYLRTYMKKYVIFGDFKAVSLLFSKNLFPLDLLHWRLTSNGQAYRTGFKNGTLSLPAFYRKLTLDHYAKERFITVRYALEQLMQRSGFFMSTGRTWRRALLWSKRAPYYRLPVGAYHPKEPRWSFSNHLYSLALRRFVLAIFRRSFVLSLLLFFLFLDGINIDPFRFQYFFQELTKTALAFRRYIEVYQTTSLKQYRRYPHQVFVHSRVDPSFRARWFSFADRMRRTGIPRSDLPYYPESDQTDIIDDLTKRNLKSYWRKTPRFWIVK